IRYCMIKQTDRRHCIHVSFPFCLHRSTDAHACSQAESMFLKIDSRTRKTKALHKQPFRMFYSRQKRTWTCGHFISSFEKKGNIHTCILMVAPNRLLVNAETFFMHIPRRISGSTGEFGFQSIAISTLDLLLLFFSLQESLSLSLQDLLNLCDL